MISKVSSGRLFLIMIIRLYIFDTVSGYISKENAPLPRGIFFIINMNS